MPVCTSLQITVVQSASVSSLCHVVLRVMHLVSFIWRVFDIFKQIKQNDYAVENEID